MTLFSVDVETSGLDPFSRDVTAISVVEVETEMSFTRRIDRAREVNWHAETFAWWLENEPPTWNLIAPATAPTTCRGIVGFVELFPKPWTFMAWPASFDYPFTQKLFAEAGVEFPFDYRTFDVKSYLAGKFGIDVAADRTEVLDGIIVPPDYPHDPYHDALAQARSFKRARGS